MVAVKVALEEAIQNYDQKFEPFYDRYRSQPVFLDLIIRLYIALSFVVNSIHKPMTAIKILEKARVMLDQIDKGQMEIVEDPEERYGAYTYPQQILWQKYLL